MLIVLWVAPTLPFRAPLRRDRRAESASGRLTPSRQADHNLWRVCWADGPFRADGSCEEVRVVVSEGAELIVVLVVILLGLAALVWMQKWSGLT